MYLVKNALNMGDFKEGDRCKIKRLPSRQFEKIGD